MSRKFPLPVLLSAVPIAAVAAFIAFNPRNSTVAEPVTTAAPTATVAPADVLPVNATGVLTYRTDDALVRVDVDSRREVGREPYVGGRTDIVSADGEWRVHESCSTGVSGEQSCQTSLIDKDGSAHPLDVASSLAWSQDLQWSPSGHVLAIRDVTAGVGRIALIDDPRTNIRRAAPIRAGAAVSAYAWTADGSLIAAVSGGDRPGPRLARIATGDAHADTAVQSEDVASLAEPAIYLYPSPDQRQFGFTQNGADGWHLFVYDATRRSLTDFGPMGSDATGTPPVQFTPDVKTPMYVAWSPDGSRIAFGGGLEPPYTMTIVDVTSGAHRTTTFSEGYPGEIKWRPDGGTIAVSTYDPDRTRHEVYVVDPATGVARHIIAGCIIVWSPDGQFMALHKDHEHGVIVVDVSSTEWGFITHDHADAVAWQP